MKIHNNKNNNLMNKKEPKDDRTFEYINK